jgi:hypothetical protein
VSRYRFIAAEKANYSVAQLCRVLRVAPSSYYAWLHRPPSPRAQANVALTEQIRGVHDRSRCTYGAPRMVTYSPTTRCVRASVDRAPVGTMP